MSVLILPGWQGLRSLALTAIPAGVRGGFDATYGLRRWREVGAYSVVSSTKNSVVLSANREEVGSALLTDAEHHLDHATEHQVTLWHELRSAQWRSPAWFIVTSYYWAYFLAMACTRLLGRTVLYLDRAASQSLSTMSPDQGARVGSGTFRFKCDVGIGLSDRSVQMVKADGRLHDSLWRMFHEIVSACHSNNSPSRVDTRLVAVMKRASDTLGPQWPSDVRNVVNYSPGAGYDSVRGLGALGSMRVLPEFGGRSVVNVLDAFENSLAQVRPRVAVSDQIRASATCLVKYTVCLYAMTEALHADLLARARLDRRWAQARVRFRNKHDLVKDRVSWPCDVEGIAA